MSTISGSGDERGRRAPRSAMQRIAAKKRRLSVEERDAGIASACASAVGRSTRSSPYRRPP